MVDLSLDQGLDYITIFLTCDQSQLAALSKLCICLHCESICFSHSFDGYPRKSQEQAMDGMMSRETSFSNIAIAIRSVCLIATDCIGATASKPSGVDQIT